MVQFRLVFFAATSVLTLAACAHDHGGRPPGGGRSSSAGKASYCLLGPFIRSPDGSLRRQDMEAGIKAAFNVADTNHDGTLDSTELARLNDSKKDSCDQTYFIDYAGTGRVTLDDFASRYRTAFDQADEDKDGIATAEEIRTSHRKPGKQRKEQPDDDGDVGAPGGGAPGSGAPGGSYPGGGAGSGIPSGGGMPGGY